ncbi:MAG: HAMP domain-containing sensor histidine kinase [Bacillota bacterium]
MKSIRTQLTLSYVGMATLVIVVMFLLFGGMVRSYLLAEARSSLVSRGQNMARFLSGDIMSRGPRMRHDESFQVWMHMAAAVADVDFVVISTDGEALLYSLSTEILQDPKALADASPVEEALKSGEVLSTDWVGASGDPMVSAFVPVYSHMGDSPLGVIALFQPVHTVTQAVDRLRKIVLQTSVLALIFAVVAGFFLARRISRPAEELSELARMLGRGELQRRSGGRYAGEFAQLANQMDVMAEQLEELLRSRTLFAALISHEIRTPITTVRGFTQAMLDEVIEPEDQKPYLETILDETRRIERLLGDLLQLERLESGQLPLEPDWVPIRRMLEDAAARVMPLARDKSVDVEVQNDAGDVEIWVDEERIAQVLGNLLDNALRHTPDGSKVTLEARDRGELVAIMVSDRGDGFPVEDLQRVFDRFYRASSSGGGVGLGLAISREIVERHGGRITAGNSSEGGAQVEFTIPRVRKRSAPSSG